MGGKEFHANERMEESAGYNRGDGIGGGVGAESKIRRLVGM